MDSQTANHKSQIINVMSSPKKQPGYLRQAWLVILLALLYGGALAGVQTTLGPKIALNKKNETYEVIPKLVPGASLAHTVELELTGHNGKPQGVYRVADENGQLLGWVLPSSGQGFADRIDMLVGLTPNLATITGIYVLEQKETPGLGNFITSETFQGQFAGKSTREPLNVVKTSPAAGTNEIRALSGATISSESVAAIINATIDNVKEALEEELAR